jgi:hypothetical protein
MRFDACIGLMLDWTDRQIPLQFLERLLDLHQLQVERPELRRIAVGEIGAQQVTAFTPASLAQLLPVQFAAERLRRDRLVLPWKLNVDQPVRGLSGVLPSCPQLDQ